MVAIVDHTSSSRRLPWQKKRQHSSNIFLQDQTAKRIDLFMQPIEIKALRVGD